MLFYCAHCGKSNELQNVKFYGMFKLRSIKVKARGGTRPTKRSTDTSDTTTEAADPAAPST